MALRGRLIAVTTRALPDVPNLPNRPYGPDVNNAVSKVCGMYRSSTRSVEILSGKHDEPVPFKHVCAL
ncbi:hypothetical protein Micbo1qcDRAFT_169515, partial [Microdochium bolleyi]